MQKQSSHTDLGKTGERRAALYLERKGYRILRYNYRCPFGEIDLIALDPSGEILCFIEVKTRSGTRYGSPWEAVSGRKRSRIRRAAVHFLSRHPVCCRSVRIDAAEILYLGGKFYIRYLENVPPG